MWKKQFPSTRSEWFVVYYMEIQDFVELPCISLLRYTWNDTENVLENCETILEKVLEKWLIFFSQNLYSPWRGFNYHLKLVYFELIFCEIAMRWMPKHLTDHKSTLVQVLAWCHQAIRPRSLLTYDPGHMTSLGHKELSSDNNSDWENHWTETKLHPLPGACDQNRANKIQINCGGLVMCNASLN